MIITYILLREKETPLNTFHEQKIKEIKLCNSIILLIPAVDESSG